VIGSWPRVDGDSPPYPRFHQVLHMCAALALYAWLKQLLVMQPVARWFSISRKSWRNWQIRGRTSKNADCLRLGMLGMEALTKSPFRSAIVVVVPCSFSIVPVVSLLRHLGDFRHALLSFRGTSAFSDTDSLLAWIRYGQPESGIGNCGNRFR
jgi:hypothetical protein